MSCLDSAHKEYVYTEHMASLALILSCLGVPVISNLWSLTG